MSLYDTYFLMKTADVEGYIKSRSDFFPEDAKLEVKEIGDGNLNYVFRAKDVDTGRSIIIKQAGEATRISADMFLSTDRGRIEANILKIQNRYAKDLVPEVYDYDEIMCTMIMEDMVHHKMMRMALLNYEIFPHFSEEISTFLANTLLLTTDLVMNHKEKKENVKKFINPDLCEISEELVYSEPYTDHNKRNNVFPPNKDFVAMELYQDRELTLEAAKLKFEFMNNAQSLIHGDLHTGSIFINEEHIFVFDPEFAFYGPMGYDIGNVISNMFFSYMHAEAKMEEGKDKENFLAWVLDTIKEVVDKFIEKYNVLYDNSVTEIMAKTEGFKEWYLQGILSDTAGVAGLESIRRTVGMANVKDITSIEDERKRMRAERVVITLAKDYIKNRESFTNGQAYIDAITRALELHAQV